MLVIGLTGPSGAGKGEVASLFGKLGVPSVDTDLASRETSGKGSPCLDELVRVFSPDILKADGTLDRKKLASIVFNDREKLAILNGITHKYILEYTNARLAGFEKDGCRAAIVDAPLLFEAGWDKNCDITVGVTANKETRIKRIRKRDGITRKQALERLKNQHNSSYYVSKCTYSLKNDGNVAELEKKVRALYSSVINK